MDSISKWGAVGVKIDFFDRDDAQIIPQYENLAKACAERHLMVDFHGCSKPTGLHRAYPNILSYEAMRCAECFKWDTTSNPDYQLQCIFARMLGGGIDYTPGSMRNSTLEKFKPIDPGLPSSLGTRSHELALFVVLSAPFASLCDSPDEYRKYPDILKYLAEVPTSWDQTIPLAARVGEYAVLAKQKGNTWYIGGLNAWGERTIQVDCSFLPQDKKYTIEIFQDKKRSNKNANLYEHKIMDIDNKNIIEMLWLLSIGIMLDYEDNLIQSLVQLIKDREAKDYIYDTLIRYRFLDWERTTNKVLYPSPYQAAITVTELAEQDKAEAMKRLEKYLKKEWYRGHSDLSWHDDHKYGINHDGYWCFESGALVKVLGLNDSSLKGLPYYPYDMVHWNDNIK